MVFTCASACPRSLRPGSCSDRAAQITSHFFKQMKVAVRESILTSAIQSQNRDDFSVCLDRSNVLWGSNVTAGEQ